MNYTNGQANPSYGCSCLSNTFTPSSCSQTQLAALFLHSPKPLTQAQALETRGDFHPELSLPAQEECSKSVLSVQQPCTHSTQCSAPLAQLVPSLHSHIPASFVLFCALCTLALPSFAHLRDFRAVSKSTKLHWVCLQKGK